MGRRAGVWLVLLMAAALGACGTSPLDPGSPAATPSTSTDTPAPSPFPVSPALTAPPGGSEAGSIGILRCTGDEMASAIDYAPDARGTTTDLVAATRALSGVQAADMIGIGAGQTSVIRDGRTIWIGTWFQAPGGWLLSGFSACGNAGIGGLQ